MSLTITPSNPTVTAPSRRASSTEGASNSTNSKQTSLDSLGSTFMQLLVQELQNQDPTAPMDSTQMVGQMISLNQLDQVASINQLLTNTFGTTTAANTAQAISSSALPSL